MPKLYTHAEEFSIKMETWNGDEILENFPLSCHCYFHSGFELIFFENSFHFYDHILFYLSIQNVRYEKLGM